MTRSNPSGNPALLMLLLGGGALAYWAYSKGYFGSTTSSSSPCVPGAQMPPCTNPQCPSGQFPLIDGNTFRGCFPAPPASTGSGGGTSSSGGGTPPAGLPSNSFLWNTATAIQQLAGSNAVQTADQWSYDFNTVQTQHVAPDPMAVFTDPSFDRNSTMTFQQWWAVMRPYLITNMGLSALMGSYA